MWIFLFGVVMWIVGYAACWFTRDWLAVHLKGASAVAADLRAKAAKVEATLRSL